jgi:hypothetical protein
MLMTCTLCFHSRPACVKGSVEYIEKHARKLAGRIELSLGISPSAKVGGSIERGDGQEESVHKEVWPVA